LFFRKNGGPAQFLLPDAPGQPWVKLVRRGDTFAAFNSADGLRWTWRGSMTVPMSPTVFIGLLTGSDALDISYQTVFDNLQVTVPAARGTTNGTGDGIAAFYRDLTTSNHVQRVDDEINFVWNRRCPAEGIGSTNFMVRWEGVLEAQYNEPYRIHVVNDHRVRLWLGGKLLLTASNGSAVRERAERIPLLAGHHYALRLEFEHPQGPAAVRLLWSSTSTAKQPIPQSQLYSPQNPVYD